jgi:hypothetical protein
MQAMKNLILTLVGLLAILLNSGCLAPYILNQNDRHSWAELNLEREKTKLRPLTWEEYHDHGFRVP